MFWKHCHEKPLTHSKSDNKSFMTDVDIDEISEELFDSLLHSYK